MENRCGVIAESETEHASRGSNDNAKEYDGDVFGTLHIH